MSDVFWLSTEKMTFQVIVKDNIVIDAAPIARKFIGQSLSNLINWLDKQGGFKIAKISQGEVNGVSIFREGVLDIR